MAAKTKKAAGGPRKKTPPLIFKFPSHDRRPLPGRLLANIKKALPKLEKLLSEVDAHWGSEDRVYRFYHGSFKVYWIQDLTTSIVKELRKLKPSKKLGLNDDFDVIVLEGTGKEFKSEDNADWLRVTRPMVEAFFHARYFLGMVVKYGRDFAKRKTPPALLPSGWAAVLHLYRIR